jgi:hypothetical protein
MSQNWPQKYIKVAKLRKKRTWQQAVRMSQSWPHKSQSCKTAKKRTWQQAARMSQNWRENKRRKKIGVLNLELLTLCLRPEMTFHQKSRGQSYKILFAKYNWKIKLLPSSFLKHYVCYLYGYFALYVQVV